MYLFHHPPISVDIIIPVIMSLMDTILHLRAALDDVLDAEQNALARAKAAEESVLQEKSMFNALEDKLEEAEKRRLRAEKEVKETWEYEEDARRRECALGQIVCKLRAELDASEAARMSVLARAEAAEQSVHQLKKEVAQVHLADMLAREATHRAESVERNFMRLMAAIDKMARDEDGVYYWKKIMKNYTSTETSPTYVLDDQFDDPVPFTGKDAQ